MDSALNVSEFNYIVEKSNLAVKLGEHDTMKRLPNSKYLWFCFFPGFEFIIRFIVI